MAINDVNITINNDSGSSNFENDLIPFLGKTDSETIEIAKKAMDLKHPSECPYPEMSSEAFFWAMEGPFKESAGDANNCSIYKAPRRLRLVNEKAFEPYVISIGPYHHHKEHLKAMEAIKKSCFDKIVVETDHDMEKFLMAMKPSHDQARECYHAIPYVNGNEFEEMMVYDGCFIVQLIRRIYPKEDFFRMAHTQTDILYDLLLLENQLPFFVLFKLYSIIVPNGGDLDEFARSALSLFIKEDHGREIWQWFKSENCPPKKDIKHLLDLVHNCCRPSPQREVEAKAEQPKSQCSWKHIFNATELEEVGINIKMQYRDQRSVGLFDIDFTKDTKELKIPTLFVSDNTERILRNFMAYEQSFPIGEPKYIYDYVFFMDNLIDTGKDVQLLCKRQIIFNNLEDEDAVAQMFNKLRDSIYCPKEDFYYAEIIGRLNDHCRNKWNVTLKKKWKKYKEMLTRDYFNSPWSVISFLGAVVLLLLTFLQTIFSVLSYVHQKDLSFP